MIFDKADTLKSFKYLTYLGFFGRNTMHSETSLDIVNQSEVFAGLFDRDNIYQQKSGTILIDKITICI